MNGLQGGGVFETPADGLTFGVVGPGKLGFAFVTALTKQKSLAWVVCRTEESAMQIAEQFDWNVMAAADIAHVSGLPDVVILTVPDAAIAVAARALAGAFGGQLAGKIVMHCSGAAGRGELAECAAAGAVTIAAHPFQTFSGGSDTAFRGIAWGVECEPGARDDAEAIVRRFGGMPVFLSNFTQTYRGLYHAAAVFASNFLTTVIASAKEAAAAAGIAPEEFLLPIITTATENALQILDRDVPAPLTGPVARGDVETVERHIGEFAEVAPHLGFDYALMSRSAAELAKKQGFITAVEYSRLCTLLDEAIVAFRPPSE